MSQRKHNFSTVSKDLESGNTSSLLQLLQSQADIDDLTAIREQKLLLKIRDAEKQAAVADSYNEAVERLLRDRTEFVLFEKYADFIVQVSQWLKELTRRFEISTGSLKIRSAQTLFQAINTVLDDGYTQIMAEGRKLRGADRQISTPAQTSEMYEYTFHEMVGKVNDASYAGARTLNELYKVIQSSGDAGNTEELNLEMLDGVKDIIYLASCWNGLEYTIDKVSYGEWYVSGLDDHNSHVTFGLPDALSEHAKVIGIRRTLISKAHQPGSQRWIREFFQPYSELMIHLAVENLQAQNPFRVWRIDLEELVKTSYILLNTLNVEDELLLAASGKNYDVLAYYLAAISLRCFLIAADCIRFSNPANYSKNLFAPAIPIDKIVQATLNRSGFSVDITNALKALSTQPPTSQYWNIIRKPFILVNQNTIVGLPAFSNTDWPASVRVEFVKGGVLAKNYGEIWTDYISNFLKDNGWNILQKDVKIRDGNKTLTDIDILTSKDDLLLIIQVKAIAGGGLNVYDHWKSRQVILKGAEQANIAYQHITQNNALLTSLSNACVAKSIKHIQPLVVTNSPLFTGWICKDVPIISTGSLLSLLRGAQVKYTLNDGSVISQQSFISGENMTTNEFVAFLREPMEWSVAGEGTQVEHTQTEIGSITFSLPTLKRTL